MTDTHKQNIKLDNGECMESHKNKAGEIGRQEWMRDHLIKGGGEGLAGKLTAEQQSGRAEGGGQGETWERAFQEDGRTPAKALR